MFKPQAFDLVLWREKDYLEVRSHKKPEGRSNYIMTSNYVKYLQHWTDSVWDSDLPAPSKLVVMYLRSYMNKTRITAYPSVPTISSHTGLSLRTVQKHLAILCERGFLVADETSRYGSIVYRARTTPAAAALPPAGDAPPQEMHHPPAAAAPKLNNRTKQERVSRGFKRPTLEQIKERCQEMGYPIDAEKFFLHYESNGWKVGKNPMKNWPAALAGWNKREGERNERKTNGRGNPSAIKTISARDLVNQTNDLVG